MVEQAYRLTKTFPGEERFGLTSQLRRAAVSIPSNIAEGHGRKATGAFINHLSIAAGSLMEVETCVQIAVRLGYTSDAAAFALLEQCGEIGRMLNGLTNSLIPES